MCKKCKIVKICDEREVAFVSERGYSSESLKRIKTDRERVQNRPEIYFGTSDIWGALHAIQEIVDNGSDEMKELKKKDAGCVITRVDENYNITVMDNGRGVPMDINSEGEYGWDTVYNYLNGGGKYDDSAYEAAGGLNGVGAAITQFTALYMKVISRRIEDNGQKIEYEMNFENGFPKGELIKRQWTQGVTTTGTTVMWKTDPKYFQDVCVTQEMLVNMLRKKATIGNGTHYILQYMDKPEIDLHFEGGIKGVLDEFITERIIPDSITFEGVREVADSIKGKTVTFPVRVSAAFTFSLNEPFCETYHNGLNMVEHGESANGLKAGIATAFEQYAKNNGKIGNKDHITPGDISEITSFVISTEFNGDYSSYDGQDKKAIKNGFLAGVCKQLAMDKIKDWASLNGSKMEEVIKAVIEIRAVKKKADDLKKQIFRQMQSGVSSFKNRPKELTDCVSNEVAITEIYFVEGRSAKGAAVQARDKDFQAVYSLTGKMLNLDKAPIETALKNRIIRDIIQIAGCGIEVKTKSKFLKDLPEFNMDNLHYGKFIISTDADVDGWHIQCLMITDFYKLMPQIIKEGRLFIAEAPLYELSWGKNNRKYAYSDKEKANILAELKAAGVKNPEIKRFKGLGEMEAWQMAETTMNPATRRLTRVDWPEDVEAFEKTLHELMGIDLESRRGWIRDWFELKDEQEADESALLEEDDEDKYTAAVIDGDDEEDY